MLAIHTPDASDVESHTSVTLQDSLGAFHLFIVGQVCLFKDATTYKQSQASLSLSTVEIKKYYK